MDLKKITNDIRCPVCKKKLTYKKEYLICDNCNEKYEVKDEIIDVYPKENEFSPYKIKSKYEKFGETTDGINTKSNRIRKEKTIELIEKSNKILEIGCRGGWMTKALKKKANLMFSGDISTNYLIKAKKDIKDVYFLRMDSHYLPFPKEYFDVVVITEVLEHLVSPYKALEEINRVLKTKGTVVLSVPNSMTFTNILNNFKKHKNIGKSAHLYSFNSKSILKLLRFTGFTEEEIKSSSIPFPIPNQILYANLFQKILNNIFPKFGSPLIIKAKKRDFSLWDDL